MTAFLVFLQFFSQIFLGAGFLLSLAQYFNTEWTTPIRSFHLILRTLLWIWAAVIVILVISSHHYYPWQNLTPHKKIYFNTYFLIGRNLLYLALTRFCLKSLPRFTPLALISFIFIGNFFAFDWGLSLEPGWSSNMYGLLYLVNGVQAAMAIMMLKKFSNTKSTDAKIDLVHLLLTISIFWFYLHFSQFVIVWMGNLPKESEFYLKRLDVFGRIPVIIVLCLKLLPIALISFYKTLKTKSSLVRPICGLIILACAFETFWLVRFP
jgi:hypothetical protein